jgi:hypothetical protein
MMEQQSVDGHEPTRIGARPAAEKASSVEQGSKSREDFFPAQAPPASIGLD